MIYGNIIHLTISGHGWADQILLTKMVRMAHKALDRSVIYQVDEIATDHGRMVLETYGYLVDLDMVPQVDLDLSMIYGNTALQLGNGRGLVDQALLIRMVLMVQKGSDL